MDLESVVVLSVPFLVGITLIVGRASFARWRHAREDRRKVRELHAFYRAQRDRAEHRGTSR